MNTPKEEFESLTKHPGWLRLAAWAKQHWTDELANHLRTAVSDADDARALAMMRQIIVAKDAVERLLKYPEEQIKVHQQVSTPVDALLTRGGYRK